MANPILLTDLNAWLPSGRLPTASPPNIVGNGGYLAGQDTSFWTSSYGAEGGYRLGWNGFIRVDGKTYQFQGHSFGRIVREGPNAEQIAMTYTSTRTSFQFRADSVLFNVTFMTPIWPKDYLRQSESKVFFILKCFNNSLLMMARRSSSKLSTLRIRSTQRKESQRSNVYRYR